MKKFLTGLLLSALAIFLYCSTTVAANVHAKAKGETCYSITYADAMTFTAVSMPAESQAEDGFGYSQPSRVNYCYAFVEHPVALMYCDIETLPDCRVRSPLTGKANRHYKRLCMSPVCAAGFRSYSTGPPKTC